jgi:hypothetical protein
MRILRLAVLLALAAPVAGAVETAAFLGVAPDARALAMGGAGTALSEGASALYWNPAGLGTLDRKDAALSHAELAQSARLDWAAFAAPTAFGTLAAGGTYLSQDALEGRDAQGHPTANFTASDAAVSLGWGRRTEPVDIGAAVKFVQSHIGSAQAETAAFDAGARKTLGAVTLGAALRDAGPGLKYDSQRNDLPLRVAFGAGYAFPGGHAVAAEVVNGPRGAGTDVGLGGEYRAARGVLLRAGYATQSSISGGTGFDAAAGLTLGVGLRLERWSLDYAAAPMGELGSTHRFTLGARW